MKQLCREPLLHFLLLGAGLFLVYGYLDREPAESDPQTIVVDREGLRTFLQYRSGAFDVARFDAALDALAEEQLQTLIEDYVREEALYREAKALRLDSKDYVARLRLIQQLEFITRGVVDAQAELTEQEIHRYYEAHRNAYRVKAKLTFTHVFFGIQRSGVDRARELAQSELGRLNRSRVRFDQAPAHGERFLYHANYVQREPDEIASHFGVEMKDRLLQLQPSAQIWRGPFRSPYGFHLVLLTRHDASYLPPLEDVRQRVEQEARQALLESQFEQSIQSIVSAYRVKREPIQASDRSATKTPS
jgi:hypothetical protein